MFEKLIFSGSYQGQSAIGYKHIYFNATPQALKIWTITVLFSIAAYELTKYLFIVFQAKQLRISMLLLIILDIYPHYYAWWMYFNYYNDDFYKQYIHQMFFTVTEIVSTVLIVTLCSKEQPLTKWKVMVIMSISCVHIVVGGLDQFISQIVFNDGKLFQKMRNLGFLIPDFFHILLPVMEIRKYERSISFDKVAPPLFNKRDKIQFIAGTSLLCVLGKFILR